MLVEACVPSLPRLLLLLFFSVLAGVRSVALAGTLEGGGGGYTGAFQLEKQPQMSVVADGKMSKVK